MEKVKDPGEEDSNLVSLNLSQGSRTKKKVEKH